MWLRIFESFPEGVALVRNNIVLFANKSFFQLLDLNYVKNIGNSFIDNENGIPSLSSLVGGMKEYEADNLK